MLTLLRALRARLAEWRTARRAKQQEQRLSARWQRSIRRQRDEEWI